MFFFFTQFHKLKKFSVFFFPRGSRGVAAFFPLRGCGGQIQFFSMGVGQGTSWMSRQLIAGPLLMAVAASQGANCTSGATLGFSILLKDTSTCSSVLPWGAGIRTSDLLITSQPALPTELQPPQKNFLLKNVSFFTWFQGWTTALKTSEFFFWWHKNEVFKNLKKFKKVIFFQKKKK